MATLMFSPGGRMGDVTLRTKPETLTKAGYLDAMASMIDRKVKATDPDLLMQVVEPVMRNEGLDLTLTAPGRTMVEASGQLREAMGLEAVAWPVARPEVAGGQEAEDLESLPLREWLMALYRE